MTSTPRWYNPWNSPNNQAPGASKGLLAWIREQFKGWLGPRESLDVEPGRYIRRERAASGPRDIIFPWFLPYIDDYTGETQQMRLAYRRMLADPNVKSAVLGKLLSVAALDLQVIPSDKKDPQAKRVADFVDYVLNERITGCVPNLIWSVLAGALVDGYSVCEKVWAFEEQGKWAGQVILRDLKPKDTGKDVILLTDEFRNIVGVQGLRYNAGQMFSPAEFLIYQHLPLFQSPTGMSDLRAIYSRYWLLDTALKLRAMAIEKRALPVLVGHYETPDQKPSLDEALKLVRSQSWFSVPLNARVEAVNLAGTADTIFSEAIKDLKHDIFMGIQGAILQALEGTTTDGRGNSQVHRGTADLLVWYLAATVTSLLNDRDTGLIKDLVDLNFAVPEYPKVTLSAVDVNELLLDLQVDQGLLQSGLDLSKEELYERYGRTPPQTPEDTLKGGQQQQGAGMGATGGAPASPFDADDSVSLLTAKPRALPPAIDHEETTQSVTVASAKKALDSQTADSGQIALGGGDGQRAETLLRQAQQEGAAVLTDLTYDAVRRMLSLAHPLAIPSLFTPEEQDRLATVLAAVSGTADLLGRSRVLGRLQIAKRNSGRTYAEENAFASFDDNSGALKPLLPTDAIAYFQSLQPGLQVDPAQFAQDQERKGFTLAVSTEQTLLERVHRIIQEALAQGHGLDASARSIEGVLHEAGVHPANPQYAEMVFRTNTMEAYNQGQQAQLAQVADEFPVWQYAGIEDGRERDRHRAHFDKYFPASVPFTQVRDSLAGKYDGFNCRCSQVLVSREEWEALQKTGARLADGYQLPPSN